MKTNYACALGVEQERRESQTLEKYLEQMEESKKRKLFDYLKEREKKDA